MDKQRMVAVRLDLELVKRLEHICVDEDLFRSDLIVRLLNWGADQINGGNKEMLAEATSAAD